jgi:RsiW-degrading membrane proteinase PrsW (M82 family)
MWAELAWSAFLSLIPGLFWMWHLLQIDRLRRVRLPWLAVAFGGGAGSGWATLASHDLLEPHLPRLAGTEGGPLELLLHYVVWVGLFEEFWKMTAVRLTVYNLRSFREPLDGLIYAGAAALGFATLENVIYIQSHGVEVLLGRAILSTFGHVLMSAFWGYPLGLKGSPAYWRQGGLLAGLATAACAHGLFDWLLSLGQPLLALGLVCAMWWVFWTRLRHSLLTSSSRVHVVRPVRECPECRTLVRQEAVFCTSCGRKLAAPAGIFCPNCLVDVPPGLPVCACGCHLRWS